MKWTAEADLVVGLAVGSGKRKLGVGLGIGRRKIIKNVGIDLGKHHLNRCCVFFLKNSSVLSLNWSLDTRNSILLDRDKAMKRSNVFNLLLQMMPASHHPVAPSSPDHWSFLVTPISTHLLPVPENSVYIVCTSNFVFYTSVWISFARLQVRFVRRITCSFG